MKIVNAKNRLEQQNPQAAVTILKSRLQSNLSNRILLFTLLVPPLILISFASFFNFLAAKIRETTPHKVEIHNKIAGKSP